MALSEKRLEELYAKTVETAINIQWMREKIENSEKRFYDNEKRITQLEREQSILKGKLGTLIIFLTLCTTILIQGIGWILSHLFNIKGEV
jgi:hypothetical protein